jgi:hypothetical protein
MDRVRFVVISNNGDYGRAITQSTCAVTNLDEVLNEVAARSMAREGIISSDCDVWFWRAV